MGLVSVSEQEEDVTAADLSREEDGCGRVKESRIPAEIVIGDDDLRLPPRQDEGIV